MGGRGVPAPRPPALPFSGGWGVCFVPHRRTAAWKSPMNSRRYIPGVGGHRLLDRDMGASGDGAPGEPAQVDRHRRPAGLGLYRGQQPENAPSKDSAIPCDIAARHFYEELAKAPWTAFSRRPGDLFCDRAMDKVLPAWGPSCA